MDQKEWSGRPGSNRRHPAWEAGVLPLNYSRSKLNLEKILRFAQDFASGLPLGTPATLGTPRSLTPAKRLKLAFYR